MTLVYLAVTFLTGVYAGSLLEWPAALPLILGAAPLWAIIRWQGARRFFAGCLLAFLLGMARWAGGQVEVGPDHVAAYIGRPGTRLVGTVVSPPDVRDTMTRLQVEAEELTTGGATQDVHGLAQVTVGRYPVYSYGDRLELQGQLEQAPVFEDFSYRDYLARQGILAVAYRPKIAVMERDRGNPILAALYRVRDGAQAAIVSALPEPQAGLTGGVLLGARSSLPADLTRALQVAGLTHIVVVSGFNLTIVAAVLQRLASRRLGPNGSFAVSVAGVLAFTLLVGAGAAVVRSAIMIILAMLGMLLGRQNAAVNALALAAGLMVAWQPMLLWDIGFQLSAAATLGLVWLSPIIEGRLTRVPGWLRGGLATALAAQALTAPILADNFHLLSIISPLANLAVLWAVPWLMLAGLGPLAACLLPWPAATIAGGPAWLIASYIVGATRAAAALPWAAAPVPSLPAPVWVAYYLGIALLAGRARAGALTGEAEPRQARADWRSRVALAGLGIAALLVWAAALSLPDGKTHVAFLDVGEGNATLIRAAQGQTILVDGGPSPAALAEGLGRQLPFWQRTVDLVVLSHADEDHLLGLVDLGARYRIGQVMESGRAGDSPGYARWAAQLDAAGVPRGMATAGQRVALGEDAWLEVVTSGGETGGQTAANPSSVVLRLVVGNVSFLLPGDAEADVQRWLLASGRPVATTVLEAPHHGARAGLDAEFLRRAAPSLAVISVGADNRFGHPAPETLDLLRGMPVYRTDVHGTVEVVTDGAELTVMTGR